VHALRVAVTGKSVGPGVYDCLAILGRDACLARIDRALARHSNEPALWHAAIHILTSAGRHAEAWEYADRAIAATADPSGFALARAAALSDSGEAGEAEQAFAALGEPASPAHAVHLSRHLIRLERWAPLAGLVDRWTVGESAHAFWPYASIAWRMTGDARWSWLEGDERLVRTYDLLLGERALDDLAAKLRLLHAGSGRFLDQSVRGGTQTDGPLFSRLDPEIRTLRETVETAVADYRAGLPPIDASHPMLRHRRDRRLRFAGSWSVRLSGAGFHSNHVHSQGWISSAFYVSVPPDLPPDQGWLTLGEPQAELGLDLPALHRVEPRPGRLVLFPSMMWHGTLPFAQGERLTVALKPHDNVPNRDFVLRYRVAGEKIKSDLFTQRDASGTGGYFTLMLYPPKEVENLSRQPLELVFVLDCSGSMDGRPLEQAKLAVEHGLRSLRPGGTVAIAGIHLTDVPALSYADHLFQEKTLTSVTANTRADGEALLAEAAAIGLKPRVTPFPLVQANEALAALAEDRVSGTAVLVP